MYGQMTAGSWIYIGTQGILQGTYETFASAARVHYGAGANLAGRLVVSGGLGGMGGAQPLAVTMCGGVFLGIDVDPTRIQRRARDRATSTRSRATSTTRSRAASRAEEGRALSVGLEGNARRVLPELVRRGDHARPRDRSDFARTIPCAATCPPGVELAAGGAAAHATIREEYVELARRSMADARRAR